MNLKLRPLPISDDTNETVVEQSALAESPPSIRDQLALKKTAREELAKGTSKEGSSRGALYGTGITQKTGAKAGREFDKQQQTAHYLQELPSGEELDSVINFAEVEQLVDPDLVPDEAQNAAIDGLISQQFGCIIGKAGTGKSFNASFNSSNSGAFQRTGKGILRCILFIHRPRSPANQTPTSARVSSCVRHNPRAIRICARTFRS
jgi:hypothetical protein